MDRPICGGEKHAFSATLTIDFRYGTCYYYLNSKGTFYLEICIRASNKSHFIEFGSCNSDRIVSVHLAKRRTFFRHFVEMPNQNGRIGSAFFAKEKRLYEKTYGYFRSSPKEQNENSYLTKLLGAGVPENQIYRDKVSSTGSDCTAFRQLLKKLNVGDTLFVVKLDHLGKNCDDVKNHWQIITKERGCELDMPVLDTRLGETVKYVVI